MLKKLSRSWVPASLFTAIALIGAPTVASANTLTIGGALGMTGAKVASDNGVESDGLTTSRKLGIGGVVSLGMRSGAEPIGLELGAWYLQRKFEIGNNSLRLVRKVPTLFVPVELKLHLADVFSIGAGGFGAFRIGEMEDEVQAGNTTAFSFSSDQRKSTEFGWTASMEFVLPLAPTTGLALQARYFGGLSDSSNDGAFNEKIDDFVLMAGIKLGM